MKATIVVILSVLFVISGLWFVTSKISENSQENLKKEFLQEETKKVKKEKQVETPQKKQDSTSIRPNYQELLSKNKELESQQNQIKNILSKQEKQKAIEEDTYVSEPIDSLLDDTTIETIKAQKEETTSPTEDFSLDTDIGFKLTDWKLMGTKKNVLVISFKAKNNTNEKINSKLKVFCSTFDENGDFASTRKGVYSVWLNPGEVVEFKDQVLGTVSKNSISIKCKTEEEVKKEENNSSDLSKEYEEQQKSDENNDILSILEE